LPIGQKIGELWFTKKKVIGINVDPPTWIFSGNYISAVRECYCLKFVHMLQPHKLYIHSDLERRRVASSWALPHVPSLYLIFVSSFLTGLLGFVWFLVFIMFSLVNISQVISSEL